MPNLSRIAYPWGSIFSTSRRRREPISVNGAATLGVSAALAFQIVPEVAVGAEFW